MLAIRGLAQPYRRAPARSLTDAQIEQLRADLERIGVFEAAI